MVDVNRLSSNPSISASVGGNSAILAVISRDFVATASASVGRFQQGHQAERLDKRGATLTPPLDGVGNAEAFTQRRKRWALRDVAASILRPEEGRGPSVCGCGRAGFEVEEIGLHLGQSGAARTSGTFACDSGWLCPVCAPRKGQERRDRMAEVFDHVKGFRDGQMVMCTLTVRHSRGQGLADLRKVVQAASRKARQGAPWARRKKKHGIFGVISAPEVTFSKANGWHFHIHTALLLRGTGTEAQDLGEWFVRRYIESIPAGFSALLDGQDVSVIRSEKKLAEYIAKGVGRTRDVAWEMAGQATKKARSKDGLHPFEILELASGNDGMRALWLEYAVAMKGVRSCVVSPAIAAALGIEEDDDEERPGDEDRSEEQPAGYLRRDLWNTLMSRKRASTVLAALEDFGVDRWEDVERLAFELSGMVSSSDVEPIRRREHAPSAWAIAFEAQGLRWRFRTWGDAIRAVMDSQRGFAVARGMSFQPPRLRAVLEMVGAS